MEPKRNRFNRKRPQIGLAPRLSFFIGWFVSHNAIYRQRKRCIRLWNLLGIIFSLIGESETFSDEYTECLRNPSWKTSGQPIVHQYREFYEQSDYFGN